MTKKIVKRTDANNETLYFYTHSDAVDVGEGSSTKSLTEVIDDTLHKSAQTLTNAEKTQVYANLGLNGVDDVPTENSNNIVRSGGVKAAIDDVIDDFTNRGFMYKGIAPASAPLGEDKTFYIAKSGDYTAYTGIGNGSFTLNGIAVLTYAVGTTSGAWTKNDIVLFDEEPTAGSDNLVKSGGVGLALYGQHLDITLRKRYLANGYYNNIDNYACTNVINGNGTYVFPQTSGEQFGVGYKVYKYISDSQGELLSPDAWINTALELTINDPFIVTFNGSASSNWAALQSEYKIDGIDSGIVGRIEQLENDKLVVDDNPEEGSTNPVSSGGVYNKLAHKVNIEENKGLSTNDYSNTDKTTVKLLQDNTATSDDIVSKNLFDMSKLVNGYRVLATNGALYAATGYSYIEIDVENLDYITLSQLSSKTSGLACAQYDNNGTFIAGTGASLNVTTKDETLNRFYLAIQINSNAKTFKISSNEFSAARQVQIENGSIPTSYEEYFEPVEGNAFIKEEFVSPTISSLLGNGGLKGYKQSLIDGSSISIPCGSIRKNQRIHFYAKVTTFDTIYVGKGLTDKGYLLKVDNTNIQFKAGISSAGGTEIAHGLTIDTYISISISIKSNGSATIKIDTLNGSYSRNLQTWANVKGEIVAVSNGSVLTECMLSWNCEDYKKPIWAFGDSYFSHYSEQRWPYYLVVRDENDCCLLNAFPGENSFEAYDDFLENIKQGCPKFLIWCLGMNDPDQGAVNNNWLSIINKLESFCAIHSTELILSTIPCVPSYNHTYKNAWIKASGYRYIDFAESVGAEDTGSSWITGTLSRDNVHPTAEGAKLLYARAIADVPELLA